MRLDAVAGYRVLVMGDAIYDCYKFCTALGKSIKETVISVKYENEETYKGGVWAGASHIKDLCAQVDVFHGDRVWTNTRFLEAIYKRKLFTLHSAKDEDDGIMPEISSYDLVIVCDFGHGTMTKDLIEKVSKEARFLAVNAQTNSQNFGFNLITKYPRADYVVLDELEARLATHDNHSPIEDIILKLGYRKIVITLGAHGAVGFDREFYREIAQDVRIVDTMGAGDAALCVSAPFAAARFDIKDLVHIANVAGAIKVGMLGHRSHVTKSELEKHL